MLTCDHEDDVSKTAYAVFLAVAGKVIYIKLYIGRVLCPEWKEWPVISDLPRVRGYLSDRTSARYCGAEAWLNLHVSGPVTYCWRSEESQHIHQLPVLSLHNLELKKRAERPFHSSQHAPSPRQCRERRSSGKTGRDELSVSWPILTYGDEASTPPNGGGSVYALPAIYMEYSTKTRRLAEYRVYTASMHPALSAVFFSHSNVQPILVS